MTALAPDSQGPQVYAPMVGVSRQGGMVGESQIPRCFVVSMHVMSFVWFSFFEVACPGDRWGEWNRSLHSSCRGRDIEDGVAMSLRVQKVEGESRSPRDRKRIDEKDGGDDEVTNGIPCRRKRDGGERLEGLVTSSDGVVL